MKKMILLMLSLCCLAGFCACGSSALSDYDDILTLYEQMLLAKKDETDFETPTYKNERKAKIADALAQVVEDCKPDEMGYALKDINRDGTEELILMEQNHTVHAIFTVHKKKAIAVTVLDAYGCINKDGVIYGGSASAARDPYCLLKTLSSDGTLKGFSCGITGDADATIYYKEMYGKREELTEKEFRLLWDNVCSYGDNYLPFNRTSATMEAGFYFQSALNERTPNSDAVALSFDTYDQVLASYRAIAEAKPHYTKDGFFDGSFNARFSFADGDAYAQYCGILFALDGTPAGNGYAKKDLNGDGTEELILLDEHFDLIAVYSEQDGKAVPMDFYPGYGEPWIDADGRLHTYFWSLPFSAFTLSTVTPEGRQVSEILFCYGDMRLPTYSEFYIWKNGSLTTVTPEQATALFDDQLDVPTGYEKNEYTKAVAGLDYHPLAHISTPNQRLIGSWTRPSYIGSFVMTVTAVTNDQITFTLRLGQTHLADPQNGETPLVMTATLQNGKYLFDNRILRGEIIPLEQGVWMTVEEIRDPLALPRAVDCRSYCLNDVTDAD